MDTSPAAANAAPRPSFSWRRALKHWLVTWFACGTPMCALAAARDDHKLSEMAGALGANLFLTVLLLSYLFQTGRRAWFYGLISALVLSTPLVYVSQARKRPTLAEFGTRFSSGCQDRCRREGGGEGCGLLCACVWAELQASVPSKDAVAELLRALEDPEGFQRRTAPMVRRCSAGIVRY